ncbi:MFS transporter [Parapedobacter defluvii]|uniref:MFS transporter n=1 Tax=Parapedobacter defluvii TaxID=2045106 RepID=A0ABQ1LID6_9SPHI|nr:MFS transporter [Parapedobacter defluvii]GGC24770.1 MFS transporter [Parapedobacter defluvii]
MKTLIEEPVSTPVSENTEPEPTPDFNKTISRERIRIAVALFYFCQGLAFASWASRIPDIKSALNLSDAQLGTLLFALPLGQLLTMPLSGRLVTQYGSRGVLRIAAPLYALVLTFLALASTGWQLGLVLLAFGVVGNMCNIAVNTQGVAAEQLYGRSIMTSFHGAWSIAGFMGALIGLLLINLHIGTYLHFWIILIFVVINTVINEKFLVSHVVTEQRKTSFFTKPDGVLVQLGIIGFCSMATEGAMFDWSGVYFKDIVQAPSSMVVVGYASFMIMMAAGRFIGDWAIRRIGRRTLLQVSGCLIFVGMGIAVFFPTVVTASLGFMLVGLGVACVVPSVYSAAGRNSKISPGVALAMVSSVSYLGFLIGPPLIGYIAELASLRYSYAVIGLFGLMITTLISLTQVVKNGN